MGIEPGSGASGERESPAAAAPALDLVVAELSPLAASLLVVDPDGVTRFRDARASGLSGDARREVGNWHHRLAEREPLAAAVVADLDRPVVTLSDFRKARNVLLEDAGLLAAYRQIGAIDDARMLIRDGRRRLVAMIAIWRPLPSPPWKDEDRRRLRSLHPLITMAWRTAPRRSPRPLPRLPDAPLTPRQLEVAALLADGATNPEVARALGISRNTVKTHARAALTKLGAASRRELLVALRTPAATS